MLHVLKLSVAIAAGLVTCLLALAGGTGAASASPGPVASLVKDISPGVQGGGPLTFRGPAGALYFFDRLDGTLRRFDGSGPPTDVMDVFPGCSGQFGMMTGSDERVVMAELDGVLLFEGSDGAGCALWRSDGTPSGTTLVKRINPSAEGFGPFEFRQLPRTIVVAGDAAYFVEDDGVHGFELWRTDGTTAGTAMVKDIAPGSAPGVVLSFSPDPGFAAIGDTLYFVALSRDGDWELWRTDGTAAQTTRVARVSGASFRGRPEWLTAVGDRLFFRLDDEVHGSELWTSDGTSDGTRPVADIRPGEDSSHLGHMAAVGDRLVFTADDGTHGFELWSSDGTAAGTTMVSDIRSGSGDGALLGGPLDVAGLAVIGERAFFPADDGIHGRELWTSDGTAAGTYLVRDINPGPAGGAAAPVAAGTTLYFAADDGVHGEALWRSDGTTTGTSLVADVEPDSTSTGFSQLRAVGGGVCFSASGLVVGIALGCSDGTAAGTRVLTLRRATGTSSNPANFGRAGSRLLFTANGPGGNFWGSDGSEAGTLPLRSLSGFGGGNNADEPYDDPVELRGVSYFMATDDDHGTELWRSDGTVAGTKIVRDINPGPDSGWSPEGFGTRIEVVGGALFFNATDGVHGSEPWTSDGTPAGTRMIKDLVPGPQPSDPFEFTNAGGITYFRAFDDVWAFTGDLWRTDGTAAGTRMVKDVGSGGDAPSSLVALGDALYFITSDRGHGWALWRSDGTRGGTRIVADVDPTRIDYDPETGDVRPPGALVAVGDRLVFDAGDGKHGRELWVSDGTHRGTRLLKDIVAGRQSSGPSRFVATDTHALFAADDGVHGTELWTTDGTPAGTKLLRDFLPGADGGLGTHPMVAIGDTFYFGASHGGPQPDVEPWRSDGTPAGTTLLADINPGAGSDPYGFVTVGDTLYFAADDGTHGTEPWKVTPAR